jgi:hypothetical protein
MKRISPRKLRLDKETLRPLRDASLARMRGGMPTVDDGTNSGYPPCRTFYLSCMPTDLRDCSYDCTGSGSEWSACTVTR